MGLDVHKHYLIATGVDGEAQQVYGPRRVEYSYLDEWIRKDLTPTDAVVLEMTTNTWQLYDDLLPHVGSVTVVHPPHVALITRAQVMNDKIAAFTLARLHAKDLLVGVWVPPDDIRELRALIAQRAKMTRLSTQSKNRLHAFLHARHITPPPDNLFRPDQCSWWLALPLSPGQKSIIQSDLDTLAFAKNQIFQIQATLKSLAAQDERVPLLIQIPGISIVSAMTILGAIGTIDRFPSAKNLVGYAGLGGRIHDSGMTTRTGRITKAGRKDLRTVMVEAAQAAAMTHPHWKTELARLTPRLLRNKAIVAIARKLLVTVWHVLSEGAPDRFAQPEIVARKLMQHAYRLGKANRPSDLSTATYTRQLLDRLDIGTELTHVYWGPTKPSLALPPSLHAPPSSKR